MRVPVSGPVLLALVIGFLGIQPRLAQAQDGEVETRERSALAACDSGKTQEGIEILGRLYADTLEPIYIYNQGRCYQKSGRPTDALNRFREFLRVIKSPDHEQADRARQFVRELEAETRSPAPPEAAPPGTRPPPGPRPSVAPDEVLVTAQSLPDRGKTLRLTGYALAGLGAAALTSGAVMSFKARSLQSEVDMGVRGQTPTLNGLELRQKMESGDRLKIGQWVSYLTGAAAVTSAGLCLYLGRRTDAETAGDEQLSFVPVLGPGLHGAGLRGSF